MAVTPFGGATSTTTYIGTIYEETAFSTGTTSFAYIYAGGQRVAMRQSDGTINYFLPDHLGSTHRIADAGGNVVRTNFYLPFGGMFFTGGAADSAWKYTGQRLDDPTGLYYYNARYYDPLLGRFITPDTIVQSPYIPQTLNRYAYCGNNPENLVDIGGHSFGLRRTLRATGNYIHQHNVAFGLGLQLFNGPLGLLEGASLLYQSDVGQNLLVGEIIGGTAVAAYTVGGPLAWGALTGEISGGLAANKSHKNILQGVAIGGIEGAISSYLGRTIGTSGLDPFEKMTLKALVGGSMTAIKGGRFGTGFGCAFAAAAMDYIWTETVGYNINPGPGSKYGQYEPLPNNSAPEDVSAFGTNDETGSWLSQSGPLNPVANRIPLLNAISEYHDHVMNQMTAEGTWNLTSNIATMFNAAFLTTGAALGDSFAPVLYQSLSR